MATKKKTEQAVQVQEQSATAATEEMQTANAPEENGHGEQTTAEAAEVQETAPGSEKDVAAQAPELESLSVLADRHRVASWQQAALCRMMGWADGKMLTDDEYEAALAKLSARHLGGGRRK